jgi:hypothetical protein
MTTEEPIDLLAIVADYIRERNIICGADVFEDDFEQWARGTLAIRLRGESWRKDGLITYAGLSPGLNLLFRNAARTRETLALTSEAKRWGHRKRRVHGGAWRIHGVAYPEDPDFFLVIDNYCRVLVWGIAPAQVRECD